MEQKKDNKKKPFLLCIITLLFCVNNSLAYSGYVGETIYLSAPNPAGGVLDAAAWYTSDNSLLSVSGSTSGCNVRIDEYFTGSVTVTCQYAYRYYIGSKMEYGHGSVNYNISCKPSTVRLNKREVTLSPGQEVELTYTNSSGYDLPFVVWTTSDENIARVNGDDHAYGEKTVTISAESPGECTITCNGKTGYDAPTCTITVKSIPATSISVTPKELTLQEGNTSIIEYSLTPSNAYSKISWTSSNENVAKVNSSGKVTALSEGTARITATTDNGLSASVQVEVTPLPQFVNLPNSLQIAMGYTMKLTPTLIPANAVTSYTWESNDKKTAVVDNKGNVRGIATGTATVKVTTTNGKTASCNITVKAPSDDMDYRNAIIRVNTLKNLINKSLDNLK